MTQPNTGDGNAAPTNQNPPQDPATGPATQPTTTTPPTPPGFQPATGDPVAGEDDKAQQLLAAAVQAGDQPADQLGEGGKKALEAEREARKAAEKERAQQAKQLAAMEEQLKKLQPAAELFAQFRKVAVPQEEKTDTERLQEELAKLRDETKAERQARWRLEVATEKGLTREQAAELHGETPEELTAHADRLLTLFPQAPAQAPTPAPAAGQPDGATPNGQQPTPATAGPKPDPTQGARGSGIDLNAQIDDALKKGDVKTSIALKQQLAAQQRNQ